MLDFDQQMCCDRANRDHYDFELRNSKNLLVCLGESWTKGIGLSNPHEDVFGAQVSKDLDWDWLNAGGDGLSNSWALNHFEFLIPFLNQSRYESGTVVVVFTENGRDVADYSSRKFDYVTTYSQHDDLRTLYDRVLDDIEKEWISRLERIRKNLDTRFQIIIGCDMVWHEQLRNRYIIADDVIWLEPRWLDLLADAISKEKSSKCRLTCVNNLDIVNDLLKITDRDCYKLWFLDQSALALETIAWMESTAEFFEDHDKGHPNPQGHRLWADLIVKNIAHSRLWGSESKSQASSRPHNPKRS